MQSIKFCTPLLNNTVLSPCLVPINWNAFSDRLCQNSKALLVFSSVFISDPFKITNPVMILKFKTSNHFNIFEKYHNTLDGI